MIILAIHNTDLGLIGKGYDGMNNAYPFLYVAWKNSSSVLSCSSYIMVAEGTCVLVYSRLLRVGFGD